DVLDELPALSKGQAIVVGASVNAPVLVSVRERHTPHGGQDQNAPQRWVDYSNPSRRAERDRDAAPLATVTSDDPLFLPERKRAKLPDGKAASEPSFEEIFGPEN